MLTAALDEHLPEATYQAPEGGYFMWVALPEAEKDLVREFQHHVPELVDQAGATMTGVVEAIQRVTTLMAEISTASSEQSSGVSQVDEAVRQMVSATQQNAALVEQSAAAAESLRHEAQRLAKAIAAFRTAA